ncbi:MAG: hypothetical protein ACXQS1_02675 [Methermicoccaceae archaeon]
MRRKRRDDLEDEMPIDYPEVPMELDQTEPPTTIDESGDDGYMGLTSTDLSTILDPDAPPFVDVHLRSKGIATGNLTAKDIEQLNLIVIELRMVEANLHRTTDRILLPSHEATLQQISANLISDFFQVIQLSKGRGGFVLRQINTSTAIHLSNEVDSNMQPVGDSERGFLHAFRRRR